MWDHPMMWGGGWMMLLFWGGLIALVVLLLRRSGASSDRSSRDPLDLLRERYARGEIDEAEYRTRRQVLEER
jgi:putative membrane protein